MLLVRPICDECKQRFTEGSFVLTPTGYYCQPCFRRVKMGIGETMHYREEEEKIKNELVKLKLEKEGMTISDLTPESWREYDFDGRVYRIDSPIKLYFRKDGTTHRVLDSKGVVHCIPAPGHRGCVVRWKPKNSLDPVQF